MHQNTVFNLSYLTSFVDNTALSSMRDNWAITIAINENHGKKGLFSKLMDFLPSLSSTIQWIPSLISLPFNIVTVVTEISVNPASIIKYLLKFFFSALQYAIPFGYQTLKSGLNVILKIIFSIF